MNKKATLKLGVLLSVIAIIVIIVLIAFNASAPAPLDKFAYVTLLSNTEGCLVNCETVYKICGNGSTLRLDVVNGFLKYRKRLGDPLADAITIPELKEIHYFVNDSVLESRTCFSKNCTDVFDGNSTFQNCTSISSECGSFKEGWRELQPFDRTIVPTECVKLKVVGRKDAKERIDNVLFLKIGGDLYNYSEYAWWNTSFSTSANISITNNNATNQLNENFTITMRIDHAGLIANSSCSLANGDDLRVVFNDSVELDRINMTAWNANPTVIAFRLFKPIPGGANDISNYTIYCGNSVAPAPPVVLTRVFLPCSENFNYSDGGLPTGWTTYGTPTANIGKNALNVTSAHWRQHATYCNIKGYGADIDMSWQGYIESGTNIGVGLMKQSSTDVSRYTFAPNGNRVVVLTNGGETNLCDSADKTLDTGATYRFNFNATNMSTGINFVGGDIDTPLSICATNGTESSQIQEFFVGFNTHSTVWYFDEVKVKYSIDPDPTVSLSSFNGTSVAASNTAPNMTLSTMPTISPSAPNSNNQLNCTFTPFDTTNTTIFANITWTRAGLNNNSFDARVTCTNNTACGSSTLVSSPLQPNIAWTCTARLDEGGAGTGLNSSNFTSASVTILNTAPNVTTVAINASTAVRYDSLNCSATPRDAYNTTLTANFSWYKGGALQFIANSTCANGTQCFTSRVMPSINKSEVYVCGVNIFDGDAWSNETNSTSLTVSNTAPTIQNVAFVNSSIYFNTTLTVNVSYTDIDADTGTIFFNWSINGNTTLKRAVNLTSVANGSFVSDTLTEFNVTSGNNITVNVSATDGTIGTAVTAINTSVSNYVPPSIQTVNIFLNRSLNQSITNNSIYTNDSFNCTATYDDFENTTGYIAYEWLRNGILVDESSVNRTTADMGTGYSVTLGDADTTKNDIFTCRTRACDGFNSTSCSAYTNSTINITNRNTNFTNVTITNIRLLPGDTFTITTWGRDIDGGADVDRINFWFNSSNYSISPLTTSGNNVNGTLRVTLSTSFSPGNYSGNLTFFDDTGQDFYSIGQNFEVMAAPKVVDPNSSRQVASSVFLGQNSIPAITYIRQVGIDNPLQVGINFSANTTLPAYYVNGSINVTNSSGVQINHTGADQNRYINFTYEFGANSSMILNVSYQVNPIVVSNVSSRCTLTDCDVNFTIENRHIYKLDDLDFIIEDTDLPNWNDRTTVTAFFNLLNGTGGGQYERFIITGGTTTANLNYSNYTFVARSCYGTCVQGDTDETAYFVNLLTQAQGNSSNATGQTEMNTNETELEIPFILGSLKVSNVDLGASSTYVLRVRYSYSAQESSSSPGGGGGGGGGGVSLDKPLQLSAGNFSMTLKTDRGASSYRFYVVAGEPREKELIVKNTGSVEGEVGFSCEELSDKGNICGWLSFDKSSVKLKPNAEEIVKVKVLSPTTIANGDYKVNVFAFNNVYGLKGRLPTTISVSPIVGRVFNYLEGFGKPLIHIAGNKANGGQDINIPTYLISIMTLVGGTALLWYLFGSISATAGYAGMIALIISLLIAAGLPLFA